MPAPRVLRRLLTFSRLPAHAIDTTRRVIDEDADFRARVAEVATEERVGRAGWLLLHRPEGWEDDLRAELDGTEKAAQEAEDRRDESLARRRLRAAQEATERAVEELAEARREAARAREAANTERRNARDASEIAKVAQAKLTQLEREQDRQREQAAARIAELEQTIKVLRRQLEDARAGSDADGELSASDHAPAPVDVTELDRAVGRLAEDLRAMTAAVDAVRRVVPAPPETDPPETEPRALSTEADASSGSVPGPRSPARPSRRRAVPLPPATFEDTPAAAEHLVRVRDVVVLVDGYNAALKLFPDLAVREQRDRLMDAVAELAARTTARIHVVFDGADVGPSMRVAPPLRRVRASFSAPDVEADDVILALVDDEPDQQPVVVASNDRRVQDGARRRGANVLTIDQLAAVLRRAR